MRINAQIYGFDLIEWNSRESFLLEHFVDHVVLHTKMREEGVAVIKCFLTREAPEHFQMNIVWKCSQLTFCPCTCERSEGGPSPLGSACNSGNQADSLQMETCLGLESKFYLK